MPPGVITVPETSGPYTSVLSTMPRSAIHYAPERYPLSFSLTCFKAELKTK